MPFFLLAFLFRSLSCYFRPVALPTLPHAQQKNHTHVTWMGVCMHVDWASSLRELDLQLLITYYTTVFSDRHVQHEHADVRACWVLSNKSQRNICAMCPQTVDAETCHDCTQFTGIYSTFGLLAQLRRQLHWNYIVCPPTAFGPEWYIFLRNCKSAIFYTTSRTTTLPRVCSWHRAPSEPGA